MLHTIVLVLLGWLLIQHPGRAQFSPATDTTGGKRGTYHVVLTIGGGATLYGSPVGLPAPWQQTEVNHAGQAFTVRAMWHPDHRFRTGLETGLTTFYTYNGIVNGETASVKVSAIPILLVYQMPLAWNRGTERSFFRRVAVTVGLGAYQIRSQLNYKGAVNTSRLSAGWMGACSYVQPITNSIRLGAEVKWLNPTATQESNYSVQLQILWRAFSW